MNEIVEIIAKVLDEKQAEDILVLDFDGKNSVTDYFVIATTRNIRLNNAIADYVSEAIYKAGYTVKNIEGFDSKWILIDLYDVVVHLFAEEERTVYDLENLWGDVKRIHYGTV